MERRRKKDIHYLMQNSFRSFFCTARTKISIQLFTSGSLDSLNNWKRDLEGALTPACMATALPQTPSERSRHIFMTESSDTGWAIFLGNIHIGFRLPDMAHRKDLSPTTLSGACSSLPSMALLLLTSPQNLNKKKVTSSWCYKLSNYYLK